MSSQIPPDPASPSAGAVRRHHTISAHSRAARASAKDIISEEVHDTQQQGIWNDDEVVDQDWVGGVGAVGEKTSLHRQSSLPTRYHRGMPYLPHPITLSFTSPQASKTRRQRLAISPQRPSTVSPPSQVTRATRSLGSSDLTMLTTMRYTSAFWLKLSA